MTNNNIQKVNRTEFLQLLPKLLKSLNIELYYDSIDDKVLYLDLKTNELHNKDFTILYKYIVSNNNLYINDLEFQKALICIAKENVKTNTLTDYDYLILDTIDKLNKDKFTIRDIISKLHINNKELHKQQKLIAKSLRNLGCVYHGHINNKQYPSGLYWSKSLEPIQDKESNSTNSNLVNPNSNPNSTKSLHSIDPNSTNSISYREELLETKLREAEELCKKLNNKIHELTTENNKLIQNNLQLNKEIKELKIELEYSSCVPFE